MTQQRYEGLFLIDSALAAKDWNVVVEHINTLLAKHKGQVVQTLKWAERKLAFEVKHLKRGTYVLSFFDAPIDAPMKIRKDLALSEVIARGLIVRHEGDMRIPPAPTDADRVGRQDFGERRMR